MKNIFSRLLQFLRRFRLGRLAVPAPSHEGRAAGFDSAAFSIAIGQLDALPDPPAPPALIRPRKLSRSFCANHCGLGFVAPNAEPASGFFWKRDREGLAWRLYREQT